MLKEFKAFAMRGNVLDMAVGIILGVAFGKIITSFVNDVVMPPILPKATPMMIPTAMSSTFPRMANALNSFSILHAPFRATNVERPYPVAHRRMAVAGEVSRPMAVGIDTTAPTACAGALYFISTFFAII